MAGALAPASRSCRQCRQAELRGPAWRRAAVPWRHRGQLHRSAEAPARPWGINCQAGAMPAPDFVLPSIHGGPLGLGELRASGPVVLVFVAEECPTCTLAIRRLAPLTAALREAGVALVAVFEDPPEVAARVARSTGFSATALAERAPYDVSRAYGLETLPTIVLIDGAGEEVDRRVGWDAAGLEELLMRAGASAIDVTREVPAVKPGCAAKSTYDAATLALLDGEADELEDMFARGWTDGLPVVPPPRQRVAAMLGGRDPA